ncbi:MAG: flagellar hook-length control protein FliK [Deltaproteobacteria bacterium]|nr:flagellar hook-length control protein FliK [Deltaproteobacteria bacterium]MBW2659806.1 flagellar hook-length control protein FliK [Deltaproteobacteria bacterium]
MTQIAIVQPSPPLPPPGNPTSESYRNSFSPHLKDSIAEKDAAQDVSTRNKPEQNNFAGDESQLPAHVASNLSAPMQNGQTTPRPESPEGGKSSQVSDGMEVPVNLKTGDLPSKLTLSVSKNGAALPQDGADTENLPFKINIALTDSGNNSIQPAPLIENNAMLRQLQQIIETGNETKTVSVQGTAGRFSLPVTSDTAIAQDGFFSTQILQPQNFNEKQEVRPQSLRQDALAQYLEAKVNSRDQNQANPGSTEGEQQNDTRNQQALLSSQTNTPLSSDQAGSLQQFSPFLSNINNTHLQSSPESIRLPSGMIVYEENVVQQITDRFHSLKQIDASRLTLKLHPAELGALRIDLTVKEGSIKANVLAQSQHIQEIIERNLPKLKNSLASQGYTIDQIVVTAQSDTVADFNPFEQHLSNQQDYSLNGDGPGKFHKFNSVLEDVFEETTGTATGVNIKV